MSYDVDVGPESFNYTYNVAALFYDHIPQHRNKGGLSEIDGLTGKQASAVLAEAFKAISSTQMSLWEVDKVGEPLFCADYDSKNGWGSTVGGLLFLANILAACSTNPRAKVRLS